jgi:hypothetical protein
LEKRTVLLMTLKYRGSIEIDPGAKLKKKRDFP